MSRKFLVILGTVLIAVGIIGSLFTFDFSSEAVSKEETFPSSEINQIDIDSDNVTITVLQTNDSDIKVELTGKQSTQDSRKIETSVDGDTLQIKLKKKGWGMLFDFNFFLTALDLKVYLPEKEYQNVSVNSSNGKITAAGIQVENIALETNNGKVVGEDLNTSVITANTNNGKVTLKNVDGAINAKTDNGKVELITPDLERSIDLKTSNGKIVIHSEQEPQNVTFIANTDNGSIDIFGKYNEGAVIGNGDHIVKLKTNNGRIEVSH